MKLALSRALDVVRKKLKQKGLSERTTRIYEDAITTFGRYLHSKSTSDLRDVDNEIISGYITYIEKAVSRREHKKKVLLSESTKSLKIRCVRIMFSMLVFEELIFMDPWRNAGCGKTPKYLPRDILTEEEIADFFALPDTGTYLGFRDRTMLELIYGTGMRVSELVNLNISDIDAAEKLILIRQGKGHKDRIVPCTETAFLFLQEYLKEVRPVLVYFNSGEKAVFISKNGKRICACAFRQMLGRYRKKSNIKKKITPHSFRHSFATHLLNHGANVRYIQEILGHEQLSTTAIYTRVVVSDLRRVVKQYHPRENELFEEEEVRSPEKEYTKRRFKTPKKS